MLYNIEVRPTHLLISAGNGTIGVQGENNAVSLRFKFLPCVGLASLGNYRKELLVRTEQKVLLKNIPENGIVPVDREMTTGTWLDLVVRIINNNGEIVWKTRSRRYFLKANTGFQPEATQEEIDSAALAASLSAALGEKTDSNRFDNVVFPDFNSMSFTELTAYLDTVRELVDLAVDRVYLYEESTPGDSIGYSLSRLWDFSADRLESIRQGLVESYRIANGWTEEQLIVDEFIKPLLSSSLKYWSDIDVWASKICNRIQNIAVENSTAQLSDVIEADFGLTGGDDFNVLLYVLTGTVNDLYDVTESISGTRPNDVRKLKAMLAELVPTLKAAVEAATEKVFEDETTFPELCELISALRSDAEYTAGDTVFTVAEDGITYFDNDINADVKFNLMVVNGAPAIEYEILGGP